MTAASTMTTFLAKVWYVIVSAKIWLGWTSISHTTKFCSCGKYLYVFKTMQYLSQGVFLDNLLYYSFNSIDDLNNFAGLDFSNNFNSFFQSVLSIWIKMSTDFLLANWFPIPWQQLLWGSNCCLQFKSLMSFCWFFSKFLCLQAFNNRAKSAIKTHKC